MSAVARKRAKFVAPMLLLRTDNLPDDAARWMYQLKVDGYRAIAFKTGGKLHLRSRNDNDFTLRYSGVLKGLAPAIYASFRRGITGYKMRRVRDL